jgi:SAM-dependent methyltransferase
MIMEQVACDLCGGTKFRPIASQTDILHRSTNEQFHIVECEACELNFLNPRPSKDEIGKYYLNTYAFHQNRPLYKVVATKVLDLIANSPLCYLFVLAPRKIQKHLALKIVAKIKDPLWEEIQKKPGQKVLDIGCGSGLTANFWGAQGSLKTYKKHAAVYGVEVSPSAREVLNSNGITSFADLTELLSYCKSQNMRFDLIRMNWSLEHVHSPSQYFKAMGEVLTKEGQIFINVPNYDGFLYRLAKDLVEVPIHLFHFKSKDLHQYARQNGFKVTKEITFSYVGMLIYAGEIYPAFQHLSKMSLLEALSMKRFLQTMDQNGMGNDLVLKLQRQ